MSDGEVSLDTGAVLDRLADGGVVLMATDTLPGLHARLDLPSALRTLKTLKGRAEDKPFLLLAASMDQVRELVKGLSFQAERYLLLCWPGPFTVVLPAAGGLPPLVTRRFHCVSPSPSIRSVGPDRGDTPAATVAVRIPGWDMLRELLEESGPLASSSANRALQPPPNDLAHARRLFPDLPSWDRIPDQQLKGASALIDLTGLRPQLLRSGPLPMPSW